MKNTTFYISLVTILFFLSGCSSGNEVQKLEEGVYENGILHFFTGGTGMGDLVNGKREGHWKFHDKDEHLLSEGDYKGGEQDGPWKIWNPDGKLAREGAFLQGKMHGHWKFYFDDGTLESEGDFNNGLHTGIWQFFHFNTQRRSLGSYEGDKRVGKWEFWYNNGQLQEVRNYEGDENILENSWTDNGTPMVVNGTGPYEYLEYGILKEKGQYKDYKMDGEWNFFEEGVVANTVQFSMGMQVLQEE